MPHRSSRSRKPRATARASHRRHQALWPPHPQRQGFRRSRSTTARSSDLRGGRWRPSNIQRPAKSLCTGEPDRLHRGDRTRAPIYRGLRQHKDSPSPRTSRRLLRTQPARYPAGGAAADRCCEERSRPESGDLGVSGDRGRCRGSHASTGRIGPGAARLRRLEPAVSRPICWPRKHRGARSGAHHC